MSDRELNRIIQRDKPGFRVVHREPAIPADADAALGRDVLERVLDLSDLRKRYLGLESESSTDAGPEATEAEGEASDEIVVLAPEQPAADPWRPGPGPKSVVVSGRERKVIAEQG